MTNINKELSKLLTDRVITTHGLPSSLVADLDFMYYFRIRRRIISDIKEPLMTLLHTDIETKSQHDNNNKRNLVEVSK